MTGGRHYAGDKVSKWDLVEGIRTAILTAPSATTDVDVREAAIGPDRLPASPWSSYVTTVRDTPHRVTDSMVDELGEKGVSDEEIVEVTVAAAFGSAVWRLNLALDALRSEH
ncbi:MAG TPA: hypothetical protein VJ831_11670 [Jatrophihabitantaceae bacterium]|nr:hypothetical protein [Jatrophihabitantaceae bacterium]